MNAKSVSMIVVGCGHLVRNVHLPNLSKMKDVRVVGLVDASAESLEQARKLAPDALCFDSLKDALEGIPSDAVLIATPSDLHASMALQALDAGRFVYLEKPIATDLESAQRVARHPMAHGLVMVGFNYRLHPLVREMRTHVRKGSIGEVVSVRTAFSAALNTSTPWRSHRVSGGGALLDLATHDVDSVRHVTGREIMAVSAIILSRKTQADSASLLFELEGGATAQCLALYGGAETARMEVLGESGGGVFERYRSNRVEWFGEKVGGMGERLGVLAREATAMTRRIERRRHPWGDPSFASAMRMFVRGIREGRKPGITVDDGLRSLEVLLAAEESATSGKRIELRKSTC